MDWMVLLIVGLLVFLAWHVTTNPHPEGSAPEGSPRDHIPTDPLPEQKSHDRQEYRPASAPVSTEGGVQKAATVFAEPGLSGQVIDPLPTTRKVPDEAPMFSSLAMPF